MGSVNWVQVAVYVVISLASGCIGGVLGGFVIAFRLGAWKQDLEGRVTQLERETASQEQRLDAGAKILEKLPVLDVQLSSTAKELNVFQRALHEAREEFVSRRECDLRHNHGG